MLDSGDNGDHLSRERSESDRAAGAVRFQVKEIFLIFLLPFVYAGIGRYFITNKISLCPIPFPPFLVFVQVWVGLG